MGQISARTPPVYRGNNTLTLHTILTLTLSLTLTLTLNITTILNPTLPNNLRGVQADILPAKHVWSLKIKKVNRTFLLTKFSTF